MWFDSQAVLANIEGDNTLFCEPDSRATCATTATQTTETLPHVAQVAPVARPLARITESAPSRDDDTETFEERAAICQIEGGVPKPRHWHCFICPDLPKRRALTTPQWPVS